MPTRRALRLYIAALLMDVGFFSAWAGVPFLVHQGGALDMSDGALGALRALSAATYICGTLGLAPRFDFMDKVRLARGAALLVAICFALAAMASRAWLLFLWLPLGGLALSGFWPTVMALVGEGEGDLARRIGSFNCWWSAGKAGAFLFCGTLLEVMGNPAFVIGSCAVLTLIPLVLVPRVDLAGRSGPTGVSAEGPPGGEAMFRAALLLLFTSWFVGTSLEVHLPKGFGPTMFAARFGDSYALGVNVLLFLLYLGMLMAFVLMRWLPDWPRRPRTLVAGALVLAACQGTLTHLPGPVITGGLLLVSGLCFGLAYGQSLYHAQAGRSDRARRSGIHEGVLSLGSVAGPLLGGVLLDWTARPVAVPFLCFGASLVAAAAVILGLRRGWAPGAAMTTLESESPEGSRTARETE